MDADAILDILFVFALALLLLPVFKWLAWSGGCLQVRKAIRDAGSSVFNRPEKSVEIDPFEMEVKKEVQKRYQKTSETQLAALTTMCTVFCLNTVLKNLAESKSQHILDTFLQKLAVLAILFCVGGCSIFKRQLVERYNEFWKPTLLVLLSLLLVDTNSEVQFYVIYAGTTFVRLTLSPACENISWIMISNICFSVVTVVGMIRWKNPARDPETVLVIEMCQCFGILLLTRGYTESVYSSSRQMLRIRTLTAGRSRLEGMLTMMCDVVVVLDGQLRLDKHYPNLASMLLLNSQRNLAKTSLLDLLEQGSEDRLSTMLQKSADLVGEEDSEDPLARAGSLQMTFLDSNRTKLDVDLFYMAFSNLGEPNFLVGIREDTARRMQELRHFPKTKSQRRSYRRAIPENGMGGTPGVLGKEMISWGDESSGSDSEGSPRPPRPQSEKGQDSASSSSALPDDWTKAGANDEPHARKPTRLILPTWRPTTDFAKEVLMVRNVMQWNVKVSRTTCCKFHAALEEAAGAVVRCMKGECVPAFTVYTGTQCQGCGRLWERASDAEQATCGVCIAAQIAFGSTSASQNEATSEDGHGAIAINNNEKNTNVLAI